MKKTITRTALGVLIAIAVTTAMDANGLSAFSALPLFPLMGLFCYFERHSRQSMGFVWGRWAHYGLAALLPVLVLGTITLISAAFGAIDLSHTNWNKAWLNLAIITVSTFLVAIITEEGFFRGWLWASLEKGGLPPRRIWVWTSIAFSLWHVSAVSLNTGFDLPRSQVPIFLLNAALLGAVWGGLRCLSGSVIVASLSHGVWNGLAYFLFGYGTKVGALGIRNTAIFGPEAGILGFTANVLCVCALWWCLRARFRNTA